MANMHPVHRKKTVARKTAPAKSDEEKAARKPAYLKRKMAVSQPQDKEEQEADQVAQEVSRASKEKTPAPEEDKEMISSKAVPSAQRLARRKEASAGAGSSTAPEQEEKPVSKKAFRSVETEEPMETQRRIARAATPEEEQKPAQKKAMRKGSNEPTTAISPKMAWRKPEEEQAAAPAARKIHRSAVESELENDTSAAGPSAEEAEQDSAEQQTEQRIENTRGKGDPLPDAIRRDMEQQFGHDFSGVVIHNDAVAAELCKELNARAFTVGNDIYFAPGEYAPEADGGRELLAHELTHTVQQSRHVARKIFRVPTPPATAATPAATPDQRAQSRNATLASDGKLSHSTLGEMDRTNHKITLRSIDLPAVKKPFTPAPCVIPAGRVRDDTQSTVWDGAITDGTLDTALTAKVAGAPDMRIGGEPAYYMKLKRDRQFIMGTKPQIVQQLKRPRWNVDGAFRTYDVDHKLEFQLGGADGDIGNLWLLESSANRSSGSKINNELNRKIEALLELGRYVWSPSTVRSSAENARRGDEITIENHGATMPLAGHPTDHYTVDQINTGTHLAGLNVLSEREIRTYNLQGSPSRLVIFSSPRGGQAASIPWGENMTQATLAGDPGWGFSGRDPAAGVQFSNMTYQQAPGGEGGTGTISGNAYSTNKYLQGQAFTWNIVPMPGVVYGGAIDQASVRSWGRNSMRAKGFSPVELTDVQLQDGVGIVAGGHINCDLPLLSNVQLALVVNGPDIELDASIPIENISLPSPITVTHSAMHLFVGTRGFGAEGVIGVEIANLGTGEIRASMSTEQTFSAEGKFNFDSKLFDRAEIDVWYREGQFGGQGTIGIDQPDKIKGIRSANITASYNAGAFSASGEVQPDIPGIQQAGLTVAYSEEAGLTIGGTLQLAANPAIRSGSIEVTVNKQGEDWKVAATGTAQPAIPGVDSQLTVSYDDGAFTAEFSGSYARGMMSGTVTVGATNRAVAEDGTATGDPMPGGALNIYGSGSATIQIAPWLQGTAGIRFDPNGEVTVSGEIGIPGDVEIFARKEIEKSLLNIAIQVPIVPGIVAEVGGGLTAVAGIGPGVIDQLRIGITYNPAHEEDTHVTGDAHLRVPADAGLRLSVRAGIGLGITGASATGGLEIGGTLGIEGAAEAGVHIDWTPNAGLDLTADLSVTAQPSFTFDISGYVSVRALGMSVYDQRWQLASYSFGSDFQFGISLPVHYHEGEPFDVSLDDVQFQVPDIDPGSILSGLIERIA